MNIGLVDVDGHNFPNFALMRLSAYYKGEGAPGGMGEPVRRYDKGAGKQGVHLHTRL